MKLSKLLLVGATFLGIASALTAPANANYFFSGSGSSGNFVGQASEPWILNNVGPFNNWGSPGVSAGITPYLEALPAFGLDLTFFGVGPLDPAQIVIGNGANCGGTGSGGTTMCNEPFGAGGIWQAFLTGTNSISFRAQNIGQVLDPGENFFVNVFFTGDETPREFSFTGVWITEFAPDPTPLPGALPLFASGLGALGLVAWRKRRKATAQAR